MRIVYISGSTIPSRTANSIHVMKMCQAFAKNGHEVILLALNNCKYIETEKGDIYDYYGVKQSFEIIRFPWLPIKGRGYIYGMFAAKKAKELKPDIIYCRNTAGCYFATKCRIPVIFECHSPIKESGRISNWMFEQIILSKQTRKFVVITEALKKYYLHNYSQLEEKIQVAPDGADPMPESVIPVELPNKGKRLQVGYVGHLYQGRGIDIILSMAGNCHWADFHVIGGTEEDIQHWKNQGIGYPNVTFHGFIPPSRIPTFRAAFDVFLAPYQKSVSVASGARNTVNWMSPLKVFEYMTAGKAIISSDLPVLTEILTHEQNCLLCTPNDPQQWIKALTRLKDDEQLRDTLGRQAKKDLQKNYTWRIRAGKLLQDQDVNTKA